MSVLLGNSVPEELHHVVLLAFTKARLLNDCHGYGADKAAAKVRGVSLEAINAC